MTFSDRLNSLLILNNMSQGELARKTGLTRSAVCRYCKGNRVPSAPNILKICEAFNISADYLLGRENN